jgi:hypothetical protein
MRQFTNWLRISFALCPVSRWSWSAASINSFSSRVIGPNLLLRAKTLMKYVFGRAQGAERVADSWPGAAPCSLLCGSPLYDLLDDRLPLLRGSASLMTLVSLCTT